MTMTEFDRIFCSCEKNSFTLLITKLLLMYSAHNQQFTALFLVIFELLCLTSYPRF